MSGITQLTNNSFRSRFTLLFLLSNLLLQSIAKLEHLDQDLYFEEDDDDRISHEEHQMMQNLLQQGQSISEIQDKQKLESHLESEKARQVAVMEKIQRLEKFREKLSKQAGKWDIQETKARDFVNISSDCDYGCSKQCYLDYNQTTVINTFVSCIAPKCKCLNQFALQHIPEPFFNETEYNQRRLDIAKKASERVAESWPTEIRKTYMDATGYDLIRDCDIQCHRDCFSVKKYVPFDTLLQCPRYRCNCWYRLDEEISKQIPTGYLQAQDWSSQILKNCDKSCARRCLSSFGSKPEVEFCVQYKCGCKIEQGTEQDLLMERLGFNRDRYMSKSQIQEDNIRDINRQHIIDDDEDESNLDMDNIKLEKYREIIESDGSKIKQRETYNQGQYKFEKKNITETPQGIREERVIEKATPQALFNRIPGDMDNSQQHDRHQSDYEIDQRIRRDSDYMRNRNDLQKIYHDKDVNEPYNWNFYEEKFPYKDQVKIREYRYEKDPQGQRQIERERYQSNINYTEFNVHVDLYPSQDQLNAEHVTAHDRQHIHHTGEQAIHGGQHIPQGRQHIVEGEIQTHPYSLEDILDQRELQEYKDYLKFKQSKEAIRRISKVEQQVAEEEEVEEVEKKEEQKKSKGGKQAHGKSEKGKEKKGKKSGDYVALYDIEELMVDNEIGQSSYESLTVFVLLMVTIALILATFQVYNNYMKTYDEKRSRLMEMNAHEDINFHRLGE